MDKFGIFKLLNSFLNLYEQNKSSSGNSSENNVLSNLLSSLAPQNNLEKPNNFKPVEKMSSTATNTSTKKSLPPLQNSMLATMTSHDEFVKRVKQKS